MFAGTVEDMDRQARRQVRVTKEHKSEVQRLLKLMGIPFHDVGGSLFGLLHSDRKLIIPQCLFGKTRHHRKLKHNAQSFAGEV